MKEILIQIKQRFIEPVQSFYESNENYKGYDYRNAWRLVGKVDYDESLQLFSFIKNDSQLAYWLVNKYGQGEYNLLCWQKGHKAFWLFLHLQCYENYYIRVAKKKQPMTAQLQDEIRQYRRLESDYNDTSNEDERLHIKAKLGDLERVRNYFNCNNETRGCREWIQVISKEMQPTNYMEYGIVPNEQTDEQNYSNPFYDSSNVEETNYTEPIQEPKDDSFRIW